MRTLLLTFALLSGTVAQAQNMMPDWYILERGCTVGVIKPGVNDFTLYMATHNNKPLDREGLKVIDDGISFAAGSVVLIYAKENGEYIATDMEGRNLVIKGGVTKVERGEGCTVAYLKEDVTTPAGTTLKKASFVWIKEHKEGQPNATIQSDGKQNVPVAAGKIYDINQTTIEMSKKLKFKTVL